MGTRSTIAELIEAIKVRDQATEVLDHLVSDRARLEDVLSENGKDDHLKQATGRSSLDNAIDSTKKMIESMDDILSDSNMDKDRAVAHRALGLMSTESA